MHAHGLLIEANALWLSESRPRRDNMKHQLRRTAACAASLPLLSIAFSGNAQVACPAVGATIYGNYTCSTPSSNRAPCTKIVVTSVSNGTASGKRYANAYYQWVFVDRVSFACG